MQSDTEALQQIIERREGNFAETRYESVLLAIARNERSVVLQMRRPPLEKQIIFDAGAPVDCTSNIATETIGRFLVSTGKIEEREYQSLLSLAASRSVAFEDLLLEQRRIAPAELYRIMQKNLARKVLDGFAWQSGDFNLSFDVPDVDSPLRIRVPQLLLTGILKIVPQNRIEAEVVKLETATLVAVSTERLTASGFKLPAPVQSFFEAFFSAASVAAVRSSRKMPQDEFNRMMYCLVTLGLLTPPVTQQTAQQPFFKLELDEEDTVTAPLVTESNEPPSMSFAVREPSVQPASVELRDELMARFITHKRKDSFDFLDVEESASAGTIARAYLVFAEKFLPARFQLDSGEGLREKAQELFLAAARAYAELFDKDRRSALLESRRVERIRRATPMSDPPQNKVNLLDPEVHFAKARELYAAGKAKEALPFYQRAADCDAQNGIYSSELIFCRYEVMKATAEQALASLKEVMRIDPACGLSWYFAGRIHSSLNNKLEAQAYLRKADEKMGSDHRARNALKELLGRRR